MILSKPVYIFIYLSIYLFILYCILHDILKMPGLKPGCFGATLLGRFASRSRQTCPAVVSIFDGGT